MKQLQKGNINDLKYRKMLINILINKVYLYTNKVVVVYNINEQTKEVEKSLIKNMDSSSVESVALPFRKLLQIIGVFMY